MRMSVACLSVTVTIRIAGATSTDCVYSFSLTVRGFLVERRLYFCFVPILRPRLPSLRSVLPSRQGDVSGKIISKTWIHSRYCLPGREMCQVAVTWNLKLETWNVRQHLETHEIHIILSRINIANTKTGRMRFAPTLINLKPPFLGKIWSNFDLLTQKGEKSSKNV